MEKRATDKQTNKEKVDSGKILSMAKRRGFLWPAYEIYGGVAGFYDYGPLGSTLRENIINIWRKYFVFGERCAEIVTTDITPEEVFIASGHVDEFKDFMVQCEKCGGANRADHLVQHLGINADNLTEDELKKVLIENDITCPDCGGHISEPRPVNLMFETKIGLGNPRQGYLRPETAQGIFVNFQNMYRYFREKLPFGTAQIGRGFRNEISPRQGIIRLREMTMAELEYFFNPKELAFPRVHNMLEEQLILVPEPGKEFKGTISQAIKKGIIASEIMAYFIGLTKKFLVEVGLDIAKLRFRKHQPNEMAHYARECWDAEALTSFGWIEIVGIANRSAYDLTAHIKATGQEQSAFIPYNQPIEREVEKIDVDMKLLGPIFKSTAIKIKTKLESMFVNEVKGKKEINIDIDGVKYQIPSKCFNIKKIKEKVTGERIIPNVIEPSFGIDRIFYTLLEHSYVELETPKELADEIDNSSRDGEDVGKYRVLTFPPGIAPVKVGVFPLMPKDGLVELAQKVDEILREKNIQTYYDESGSIGRRYARMDEVGTPFGVTIDYESKTDSAVTIRDRDSHAQVRVKVDELAKVLKDLIMGKKLFSEL